MTAHTVYILSKTLTMVCLVKESLRVKDIMWDERGVLLYSTLSQLKYLLTSGERGVVRSLEDPVYLVCIHGNTLYAFTRENTIAKLRVDPTEYLFKVSECVILKCFDLIPIIIYDVLNVLDILDILNVLDVLFTFSFIFSNCILLFIYSFLLKIPILLNR